MSKENTNNLIQNETEQIEQMEQMETEEEDKTTFEKEKRRYILKGLSSLLACIINSFGYFSIWLLGNSIVYLISFRRYYNPTLNFSYGYFLIPIIYLTQSLASPVGGTIEDIIGARGTILLSYFILCISFSFIYISKSIYIDYISMVFIGIGLSFGNSTKKNACAYFLNKKTLIISISYLVPGLLCVFLNIINEKYILNPLSESPTIDNLYYDKKIFLNFQKLIIFEIALLVTTCFLTLLLYFKNDPEDTIKFGFNEKDTIRRTKSTKVTQIKTAVYSKRTLRLFLMIFLFLPTINLINNTWRPIGIYYQINTYHLQLTTALYSLMGCISSLIFGLIGDKIQFRILFVLLSFCLVIVSFCFPLSFKNDIFYISEVLIMIFVSKGYNTIIDSHFIQVYGIKNFVEIGGIIKTPGGICEVLCVIISFYLENHFTGDKNLMYKYMYIVTGISNIISLILGCFEGDDIFIYD